ncbi:MAG: hypothetical protein M1812_004178 [Candelaria pacifica]|nr:MAG: hypothetical protein M1812_004178 [Candelaria pacifica]
MNLSLRSVTPTLFLLIEARFGPSTLQNYDGIVRNQLTSSRLGFAWRLVLGLMLALPLALSAAYKSFSGGQSLMRINPAAYTGNGSYYGMFAPPGLQLLGQRTGVSLFSNATLPFAVASSSSVELEPPLPAYPQAYGFNVLSLNNESTAMLDIPEPSYIYSAQKMLASGESWRITAPVIATVATFNHSKTKDRRTYDAYFKSFCEAAVKSSGAYTHMSMMNWWSIQLLSHPSPGDQSLQYIGLQPDPGIEHMPTCSNFSNYAQAFDINRRPCRGTWTITRGSIQLDNGSCNNTNLPSEKQLVITQNSLFLGVWYMSSLVEFLGPFATTRNESRWSGPSMATGMAAMLWSRITALNIAANETERNVDSKFADRTLEEAGLFYPVDDTVIYIRPTLRKSGFLYCVLLLQPLLIVITLGLIMILHSTPLDKGFGLISILAGIDRQSLDIVAGAALSGVLMKDVKLVIQPIQDDQKGAIDYHVEPSTTTSTRNGELRSNIVYH